MKAQVELTLRMGQFGERVQSVAIPIDDYLARDLTEPLELSDNAFSLLLASPGAFGGKGSAVTIRRQRFQLRKDVAVDLANAIASELLKMFGENDELDGYKLKDLSPTERAYYQAKQGRTHEQ